MARLLPVFAFLALCSLRLGANVLIFGGIRVSEAKIGGTKAIWTRIKRLRIQWIRENRSSTPTEIEVQIVGTCFRLYPLPQLCIVLLLDISTQMYALASIIANFIIFDRNIDITL